MGKMSLKEHIFVWSVALWVSFSLVAFGASFPALDPYVSLVATVAFMVSAIMLAWEVLTRDDR